MSDDKLGVALVNEVCKLCGAVEAGPLLMNTRLTKSEAKKVEELHGKTIGYMEEPCKDCKEIMDKAILLIGIVEAKTDDHKDPYRSGNKWGVSEEYCKKLFEEPLLTDVLNKRACFFPVELAHKLEFPDCNLEA